MSFNPVSSRRKLEETDPFFLPPSPPSTWSHPALTTLTNEQIVAELGWSRKTIKDITGVTVRTFRPPQGDIDDRVREIARQMDMQPSLWSSVTGTQDEFDTQGESPSFFLAFEKNEARLPI